MIGPIRELQRAAREYDYLFGRGSSAAEARVVFLTTVPCFVLSLGVALAFGD